MRSPLLSSWGAWLVVFSLSLACGDDGEASVGGTSGPHDASISGADSTTASTGSDGNNSSSSSSSTGEEPSGDSSSSSTGEPPPPPLDWQEDCVVDGFELSSIGYPVECTAIDVPLNWDDPLGSSIPAAALRVRTAAEERVGTYWLLDGGPGGSGMFFLQDDGLIADLNAAGWDVIIPPHRGTFSPRLECPGFSALSSECREVLEAEWGDGLRHFNTRWAAHDVAALIERERLEGELVVVHGFSYGTMWAQFYAADFPQQPTALVLDSALNIHSDFARQEALEQDAALALLQRCTDDATCSARVGYDSPDAFVEAALTAVDEGDCGAGDLGLWEETAYRNMLGDVVNLQYARNFAPLLLAMLAECDPELTGTAVSAINTLRGLTAAPHTPTRPLLGGAEPPFELSHSPVLQVIVGATTIAQPETDAVQAALDAERHVVSLGFAEFQRDVLDTWGSLPAVEFDRDFSLDVPILIVNATYDLQTPFAWAEAVRDQHDGQLVRFHDGRHGLALNGTGGKSPSGEACARAMLLDFAADPEGLLDVSCAEELPRIDVNLERPDLTALALEAFGTDDPWALLTSP